MTDLEKTLALQFYFWLLFATMLLIAQALLIIYSGIFGAGLLLSERAAAERAAAERAAAERAAALFVPLSDREREIQKIISKGEATE